MSSSYNFSNSRSNFQRTTILEDDKSDISSTTYMEDEMKIVRAFQSIQSKLSEHGVKTSKILTACEKKDRNNDGIIHVDDFEVILDSVLGMDIITRREKKLLIESCNYDKKYGNVSYMKLMDILEVREGRDDRTTKERWRDSNEPYEKDEFGEVKVGSIGEWLKNVACPAEVSNYKLFISCLEKFEQESGMRIKLTKDGCMVVPLGPDLKAQINFKTV